MMNIADGLRFFQVQLTKVELKHRVETIRVNRICTRTRVAISIIQTRLQIKETIPGREHQKTTS